MKASTGLEATMTPSAGSKATIETSSNVMVRSRGHLDGGRGGGEQAQS